MFRYVVAIQLLQAPTQQQRRELQELGWGFDHWHAQREVDASSAPTAGLTALTVVPAQYRHMFGGIMWVRDADDLT